MVCRICRCEGEAERPLFHPCKCSGTIKYVHNECLLSWLRMSGKEKCEVSKFTILCHPAPLTGVPLTIDEAVKSLQYSDA